MNLLSNWLPSSRLLAGTAIRGFWNKRLYRIIRHLGAGENGEVYLVDFQGREYALKMSKETVDLSYEIRSIQRLNEAQGLNLGFSLFDIDDFINPQKEPFSFYVMTYKKGITLKQFLYGENEAEYTFAFYQILQLLKKFHDVQFVCGDLKPEHLLIHPDNLQVSFVDYGGVTLFNEGVRQYTELYDRGSWRQGSRIADSHYDLFSITMIFLQLGIGKQKIIQIFRDSRNLDDVCDIIPTIKKLKPIESILIQILQGKIRNVEDAMTMVRPILQHVKESGGKRKSDWIKWLFSFSLVFFFFSIYLFIDRG